MCQFAKQCRNKCYNLIHIYDWYLIKKMKKRTDILISHINYHCLKQARKRRGEAGRGVGRGGEGWGGVGRGGEGWGGTGRVPIQN